MISRKKILASVLAIAAVLPMMSGAKVLTRTSQMSEFDELEVSNAITVTYVQDNATHKVVVSADESVIGKVSVVKKNGKVKISLAEGAGTGRNQSGVKVEVRARFLKEIELSGASTFKASTLIADGKKVEIEAKGASTVDIAQIRAAAVEVEAKGASTVKLKSVKTGEIELEASGASTVSASGTAHEAEYKASGASTVKAATLKAQYGYVKASGASNVSSSIANPAEIKSSGVSSIKNR